MKKYVPRKNYSISQEDAQVLGQEIERLLAKNNHKITPEEIVKNAAMKRSPIHHLFEWNNDVAAHKYRMSQARYYIRSVEVVVIKDGNEEKHIEAFFSVTPAESNESCYVSIDNVLSDKEYHKQILQNAMREVREWKTRYNNYQELSKIYMAIDNTEKVLV